MVIDMKLRVNLQDRIAPLRPAVIEAVAGGNINVTLIVGRRTSAAHPHATSASELAIAINIRAHIENRDPV